MFTKFAALLEAFKIFQPGLEKLTWFWDFSVFGCFGGHLHHKFIFTVYAH